MARLRAGVGDQAKAQRHSIKVGGLPCVADIELNVVSAIQLKKIFGRLLFVVGKRTHK